MNQSVSPISQHQSNYLPALRRESLPQPLFARRIKQPAVLVSDSSGDQFTEAFLQDPTEDHALFTIDPDRIRSASAHCSVCLSEIQVAAYRRAEQLQSVDEDRTPAKIDRYA